MKDANKTKKQLLHELADLRCRLEHSEKNQEQYKAAVEETLTESEERFRLLINGVKDFAIFMLDPGGHVFSWSSGAERLKNFQAEEIIGRHFSCFYPKEEISQGRPERELSIAAANGHYTGEGWHVRKDGSRFWAEVMINSLYDKNGHLRGYSIMTRDITERKKAQDVIAAEKERLAVTLRSIREGVISTDNTGKIILMNEVAERLIGLPQDEAIGFPVHEIFRIIDETNHHPCENLLDKLANEKDRMGLPHNAILVSREGTEIIIAYHASPLSDQYGTVAGMVLVFWNITRQRQQEEELLKAHKLESVGLLARGIAHDFNNILTVITGNINLAKTYCQPNVRIYQHLTEAEKASALAKDLTQQLITLAKGETPVKKAVSMAEVISQSTTFALRDSQVKCEFSISPDLWPIEADRAQMSQIINNMMLNAVQAMPGGGTVHVSAENTVIKNGSHLPLPGGKYIKICISDQGMGIPKEHLSKIFDPYFTTKQQGHGLGLAIIYTIVTRHNGHVNVKSRIGEGTSFSVYLPAMEIEAPVKIKKNVHKGKGKILLMDDQDAVLEIMEEMLVHLGYEVTCAKNGTEVMNHYKKAKAANSPFDAVIIDLTIIGGMGGKECLCRLKEIDPEVKAILSSGYVNGSLMSELKNCGFCGIMCKPYTMESLQKTLYEVITGH